MVGKSEVDELYDVRNNFYIGNFQNCIKECHKLKLSDAELDIEKKSYMYRAYIALGKGSVVLSEVKPDSSPPELVPFRLLAEYIQKLRPTSEVLSEMERLLNSRNVSDYHLIVAAIIYYHSRDHEAATRYLHMSAVPECVALLCQIYISIDRLDLAAEELRKLQKLDEDATLTQLTAALYNIASGGPKVQDAFFSFQEMSEKFSASSFLLNNTAVCLALQNNCADAEGILQEASEKSGDHVDSLINSLLVANRLERSAEVTSRYLAQIRADHPDHKYSRDYADKQEEFRRLAKQYAASIEA